MTALLGRTLVVALACAAARAPAQVVNVNEATNLTVALSAPKETLVVDLLGGLWQLPASGGGAVELLPAHSGVANPRFDPAGERIVFQRWVDGQWDIWMAGLDGQRAEPLLASEYNEREPEFAPDGNAVVFASDRADGSRYSLWRVDLGSGALQRLTDEPGDAAFPAFSDSGDLVYVNHLGSRSSLRLYVDSPVGASLFGSEHEIGAPSWRPGGGVIVFGEREAAEANALRLWLGSDEPILKTLTRGEDVFIGRVAWKSPASYVYAADGALWERGIASEERERILLFAGVAVRGQTVPRIDRPLDAPGPHRAAGIVGLTYSPAGDRAVFVALGDLWITGRRGTRRLTDDAFVESHPQFTLDGESVVFAGDRGGKMDLWRLRLEDGVAIKLTSEQGAAYQPAVAPVGDRVAFLTTDGVGLAAPVEIKTVQVSDPYRTTSIATNLRGVEGLEWWLDGTRLRLRAREAGATGDAVYDLGPFESSSGREPVEHAAAPELELEWSPAKPTDPYVIQVGRLFDGVRNDYQRHMDIHVDGQRIVAVTRRGLRPTAGRVLDFSDATVIPGLIDTHTHAAPTLGERLGRAWLAHGVTTVREFGTDLAGALERAEAWESGRRMGPRLVVAVPGASLPATGMGPIAIEGTEAATESLAHALAAQRSQRGFPDFGQRALALYGIETTDLAFSPVGRSYGDVVASVAGSERALSTGLATLGPVSMSPARNAQAARVLDELFNPGEAAFWTAQSRPRGVPPLANTLTALVRGGARVAVGSDAPSVPYGYGLHLELAALAAAGLPNDQVLRLATAGAATAIGLGGQLGTLEAGKLADFVVIGGDPLATIGDTLRILGVARGGVWHPQAELARRPPP